MTHMNTIEETIIESISKAFNAIENSSAHDRYKEAALIIKSNLKWSISHRMKTTSGLASCGIDKIKFSFYVLSFMTVNQIYNTVTHELAHLIDYKCRLKSDHDLTWKTIHKAMGGNGNRCHAISYELLNNT